MESQDKLSQNKSSSHLADLERDGFVVIRSILSREKLETLRAAARKVEHLARNGQWPHVRTVGKQFPPWEFAPERGIWGVQHLMHPGLVGHEVFGELYFSEEVLGIVRELLRCGDGELVMELLNMLVRPEGEFELRWHRDDIPAEADAAEEMARLGQPAHHAQYNLALVDGDESLIVVPGSHRRARTAVERRVDEASDKTLPGQLVVKLAAGDIVFYDNNVLHRGVYDARRERLTVHGSVGHGEGSAARARNVLQHGVGEWVGELDLGRVFTRGGQKERERERERAEGMRERLVRMGSERGNVGYSLRG